MQALDAMEAQKKREIEIRNPRTRELQCQQSVRKGRWIILLYEYLATCDCNNLENILMSEENFPYENRSVWNAEELNLVFYVYICYI